MRWIHMAVIAAILIVTLTFALQNLQSVTISFPGFKNSEPLAIVIVAVYLLGMVTGGSAQALTRWMWRWPKQA